MQQRVLVAHLNLLFNFDHAVTSDAVWEGDAVKGSARVLDVPNTHFNRVDANTPQLLPLTHTQKKEISTTSTHRCECTVQVEDATSGNSNIELNIFVFPLSCSGRFRRCFTVPFLKTSNIPSLEPERKRFYFHPRLLGVSFSCLRLSLKLTAPQRSTAAGDGL